MTQLSRLPDTERALVAALISGLMILLVVGLAGLGAGAPGGRP